MPVDTITRPTPREAEVLQGVWDGLTAKAIGLKLTMSPRTVETHVNNLMRKLRATTRTQLCRIALTEGWLSL